MDSKPVGQAKPSVKIKMKPKRSQASRGNNTDTGRSGGPSFKLQSMTNSKRSGSPNGTTITNQTRAPSASNKANFSYICSGCNKPIKRDKFLLKACDKFWHENCLRCDRCHTRLGELGSTLYCKANMNLCRQDYLEIFGETGVCSVCEKLICASEMVMRAKENVYHLECFACQLCNQRFCVGDRFYLCENKVVCQYDYEEHILPIQRSLMEQQTAATSPSSQRPDAIAADSSRQPPSDVSGDAPGASLPEDADDGRGLAANREANADRESDEALQTSRNDEEDPTSAEPIDAEAKEEEEEAENISEEAEEQQKGKHAHGKDGLETVASDSPEA